MVRAQSKNSPHKVGVTTIFPGKYVQSLSLRAFQSGRIIYRRKITSAENTIALRELEGPIHSAIAIPVGSEEGQPLAILYVVSDEVAAFSTDDQRVLRMIGRIVEELLMTYHARHRITQNLSKLIITPAIVDPLFKDFFSENEFVEDVETKGLRSFYRVKNSGLNISASRHMVSASFTARSAMGVSTKAGSNALKRMPRLA